MEISHITLIVANIDKTTVMLQTLFDAEEIYSSGSSKKFSRYPEKFFLLGDLWLAIMENSAKNLPKSYNHIAFKVEFKALPIYRLKLEKLGLDIEQDRSRITGEGASLYFYDYDNHLFELHTGTLADRLKAYERPF